MADPIKNFIVKRKVCLFAELNKSHTKKGDLLHFVVLYNKYRYNNIYIFIYFLYIFLTKKIIIVSRRRARLSNDERESNFIFCSFSVNKSPAEYEFLPKTS